MYQEKGTLVLPSMLDDVRRRDRALAIVVLSIDTSLLYLIGEPSDPATVWKKLSDQFMKKSWGNKLELRRKLHSLRLKEGHAVQEHIREMTELFNALSEMDVPLTEDDRVVYLLASLPESFSGLVTALEDVPKMEIVTEKLLHYEVKLKVRGGSSAEDEKAMPAKWKKSRRKVHVITVEKWDTLNETVGS